MTEKIVSDLVRRSAKKAGLAYRGVHVPRHTFCSHLAMRGAAPASLQMLADHRNLATTQRYVHLTPAALDNAIVSWIPQVFPPILETWRKRVRVRNGKYSAK